jgi:hypothetical protein
MRHARSPIAFVIIFLINSFQSTAFAQAIDGFSAARSQEERRVENSCAAPKPASAREHLRRLTEQPHRRHSEDYATAVYVRTRCVRSDWLPNREHQVWLNYPKRQSLTIRASREISVLREDRRLPTRKLLPLFVVTALPM